MCRGPCRGTCFFQSQIAIVSQSQENTIDYKNSTLYRPAHVIKLSVSDYPECKILINGTAVKNLRFEGDYVAPEVYEKDVVELDLREIPDQEVSVFIAFVSEGITNPVQGSKIFVKGGIKHLFTVESE